MSIEIDFSLTNRNTGKLIKLRGVQIGTRKKSQPATSTPIVNATSANNVLFRFTGQIESYLILFSLVDDGLDASAGDSIVTVVEQTDYLFDTIFTENFDVDWNLAPSNAVSLSGAMIGVIEDLQVDMRAGEAVTRREGSLIFTRGRIGNLD